MVNDFTWNSFLENIHGPRESLSQDAGKEASTKCPIWIQEEQYGFQPGVMGVCPSSLHLFFGLNYRVSHRN